MSERLGLIWGSAFFAGSLAQATAWLTGQPAVVLLLAIGLLTGHAGFDLVHPENLGAGLEPLVGLLVSLVLFDGGLNLRLAGRDLQRSVLQLVLVRLVLGLPLAALLAHVLAGLPWSLALVYGAIALATGPTVVTPMVRQLRLAPKLGQLLEAEGLILEPVSAVLGLVLLQVTLGDLGSWQEVASRLLLRLGGGVVLGGLAGLLLSEALRRLGAVAASRAAEGVPVANGNGLELQLTLGVLFLMFSGCEALLPESGLPAAVGAGVVVGLRLDAAATQLDELIRQLAMLAITVLFPLLAADVSWAELSPLGLGGLGCVLALMLVRWPLIQLTGLGLPSLDWKEKALLSWIAPRGIVTAAVVSLFALELDRAEVPGGATLKGLVFLTILITVGLQGFTAPWLVQRLGLAQPEVAAEPSQAG
ncbi:sodium:proton antiporter [Cyanobium gracile UHCC 0139]|uniref:Sodium:proton antiporter n=1 Tax=Cyanobium gracile UHCC 0139 TaxID=3110308 RepID=A0ABU5RVF6_9CYAN|nr:sodium:proton antiporter [Cyanobium gracile]MEA5391757.1 sodium:proton antiporter [Cyanobium gracile UHCC 0139]